MRIEDVGTVAGWDQLVLADVDAPDLPRRDLYLSSGLLRSVAGFGSVPLEPLVLREDDAPDGAPLGALVTRRLEEDEPDPRVALDDDRDLVPLPARLVGGLYDGRTAPLVRPGLDPEHERSVVHRLLDAAEDLARERGERTVVCRSVDAAATGLRSLLVERGYAESPGVNHLVLPVPPDGLAGFEASLTGRYRNMVRREQRKLRDAGVELAVEPMTPAMAGEAAPLLANLLRKHGHDTDAAAAGADLRLVRRTFRDDSLAVTARRDGALLGVLELLVLDGHGFGRHAGFDYEAQGALPVYFGVLFYGLLDLAAERGLATVDYTIGTEGAKTARGCVPRPTVRLVKRLEP